MINNNTNNHIRILFLHGLESDINGTKAKYLSQHYKDTCIPNLKPFWLIPIVLWRIIYSIITFKPDIIIGSSFGGFLLLFLIQLKICTKSSILLAPAMSLIFKHRSYINSESNIIIVAGKHDDIVPLENIEKLYNSCSNNINNNIQLIIEDDDHRLNKCMIEENKLQLLINQLTNTNSASNKVYKKNNNILVLIYYQCIKLWVYCMFILFISFLYEPFTWYYSIKKMKEISKKRK